MTDFSSETLELVGQLHEGVVDDDAWMRGLDKACEMIGSSVLLFGAVENDRLASLMGHRIPQEVIEVVTSSMITPADNPWVAAACRERLRRPVTIADLGGQERIAQTLDRTGGL